MKDYEHQALDDSIFLIYVCEYSMCFHFRDMVAVAWGMADIYSRNRYLYCVQIHFVYLVDPECYVCVTATREC